ncbi:protein Dr1-like [Stylophora pistillata]|uniref:Protein Dr1 n=1 Tax=Stylophora pistillata TaxID=50429 RepID=A0A2B4SAU0_STYPI|nr:protein Dr1-like [Stylophora pistillata]PFX27001.1 Protein Dr1 [Stylophora pistillata]
MAEAAADDDVTLPRAAVNKMIKEMIPNVRVSNDARELILNCCTEFIHLVSSEANEICNRQLKNTILPEHVFQALQGLGFTSYIEEVRSVLQECKTQAANKRRASTRLENLGIPEEELLRQQQELFQQARIKQAQAEQEEFQQLQQAQTLAQQQQQQQQQMPQPSTSAVSSVKAQTNQ